MTYLFLFPFVLSGTADWHLMRKFSLTSSQAHKSFLALLPKFKENRSFIKTAEYLYGPDWATVLNIETSADDVDSDASTTNGSDDDDEHDPLNPATAREYFQNFPVPDEDDDAQRAALNFIQFYVCDEDDEDGQIVASEEEAKEEISDLSARVKKNVLALLGNHVVHETYRRKPTAKDLILWLQRPNSVRNFMFYKKQGLKDLMAARGIELASASSTISNMIEALAGSGNVCVQAITESCGEEDTILSSPEEIATKAVLEKSFLPHQKGQAREYCSLGHRLEKPILQSWIEMMEGLASPAPEITVCGAYTAGLAARKNAVYAKDSIDFVLIVQEEDPLRIEDVFKTWGFEVKGRITARTAAMEERSIPGPNQAHVRLSCHQVHGTIQDPGERFQVFHHAYVYDLDTVVFAVGDNQSELIRSAIIDFTDEMKTHFEAVLKKIKDITLDWAYPAHPPSDQTPRDGGIVQIPDKIFKIAQTIKPINGDDTLQGTANLWLSLSRLHKPIPSLVRLIPAIYAFWNAVKGGSDTTTKLMDACILCIPKFHLNAETVAVTRILEIILVLVHRLCQVFTAKKDINFYSDLCHYRDAASERITFHVNLLTCRKEFKKALDRMEAQEQRAENQDVPLPIARPCPPVRRQPLRQQINGVVPERATFGAALSTKTPTKLLSRLRKGTAPPEVETMLHQCTGLPMKYFETSCEGKRRQFRCAICQKKTTWRCVGCKRWLCVERKMAKNQQTLDGLYECPVKGDKLNFQKSCFHKVHQAKWASTEA